MDLLYRLLLRAYPRRFRREYGGHILEMFREQRRRAAARRAPLHSLRFGLFAFNDLLRGAAAERTRRWHTARPRARASGRRILPVSPPPPGEAMAAVLHEIHHAARRLLGSPAFSVTAMAIVALGVGANTAIFSFVDAVLLRPPPYAQPERIVSLYQDSDGGEPNSSSFPAYRGMREYRQVFTDVAATMTFGATLVGDDGTLRLAPEFVTSNYFDVLGLQPTLGRDFDDADELDGGEAVAILGHSFWESRFAADPGVLGRQLRINGATVTVVGVGPRLYGGIYPGFSSDAWISLSALRPLYGDYVGTTFDRHGDHWFHVRARLEDGVTVAQAQAAMDALAARLAVESPEENEGRDITVFGADQVRLHPAADAQVVPLSVGLMSIVGLVLLIACSNLANLLLVRATARTRDVSVRRALGASRARIVGHVLAESVLLALGGGALGVLLAWAATRAFLAADLPLPFPGTVDLRVDLRLLSFAIALAAATGLLFGILPALRLARTDVTSALKADSRSLSLRGNRWSLGKALVIGQIAVSFVVLVVAGLYVRSLGNAQQVDVGVDVERLAAISTDVTLAGLAAGDAAGILDELRERIAALPGVESVTAAEQLPVRGGGGSSTMVIEDYTSPDGTGAVELDVFRVGTGYFQTMGIPVLHGRVFADTDTPDTPRVLVVSAAMARAFWGRTDVVGRRLRSQGGTTWLEIVGVVEDVAVNSATEPLTPLMYRALAQGMGPSGYVIARTRGNPDDLLRPMRAELATLDPRLTPTSLETMSSHLAASFEVPRLGVRLLSAFGLLGLALASLGLYGVVAFTVGQRQAELGIRMALGADRGRVIAMVLREVLTLVGVAIGIGAAAALLLGPQLASGLYRVQGRDPLTLAATAALMAVTAVFATWLPTRRAATTDPVRALRQT